MIITTPIITQVPQEARARVLGPRVRARELGPWVRAGGQLGRARGLGLGC